MELSGYPSELEFVSAVNAGGSVKFLPAVLISPFSLIFVFLSLKLLKLGEIDGGVKFIDYLCLQINENYLIFLEVLVISSWRTNNIFFFE